VENGLSLQEHLNNEVWCALSIVNIPNLPFEDDRVYVIVFDNDNKNGIVSDGYKQAIDKILRLKNKHIFYCMSEEDGKDANDLHKEGKLGDFLNNTPFIPIPIKQYKYNSRLKRDEEILAPVQLSDNLRQEPDSLDRSFARRGLIYNSLDVAKRFLARYGHRYKVVNEGGDAERMYVYDNGIYRANRKASEVTYDIARTLSSIINEYYYITNPQLLKDFRILTKSDINGEFETRARIKKAIRELPEMKRDLVDFDSEKENVINFANGYCDLNSGKLCDHTPNKLFLKMIDTAYYPSINLNCKYAEWIKFLNSMFNNDQDKIKYFQKCIGYTFGTSIAERKVFFVKGESSTGKSTLLDVIMEVMKAYCKEDLDKEVITSNDKSNNYVRDSIAKLKGIRMANISEFNPNQKVKNELIKRCTKSNLSADEKFKGTITFANQTKFWIDTNHLDFEHFEEAVKSRIILFEFKHPFYKAGTKEALATGRVIDKELKQKLLTEESRQFILRWIVEGHRLYKEEGLSEMPKDMEKSLERAEKSSDALGSFIKERLKKYDPDTEYAQNQKTAKDIYGIYRLFEAEEYGTSEERIIGLKTFYKRMRQRYIDIDRTHTALQDRNFYLIGYCLKSESVIQCRKLTNATPTKTDSQADPPPNGAESPPIDPAES
jgi:P4 family phage/plasmid primase-like protien